MDTVDVTDRREFTDSEFNKLNLFETERMFSDVYCFEPGQEQEPHGHDDADKLYYVLDGEGTFVVGDEERTLGPGEAVIAPAGDAHGVRNEGDEQLRTLVFMAWGGGPDDDSEADEGEHGHSHDHDHSHGHDHSHTPHEVSAGPSDPSFAVVTVSTSRSETEDASGDAIEELAEAAGYGVTSRAVVGDDIEEITAAVRAAIETAEVVVTSGGTGLTDDDVTVDAVRPLFDREIPGFGEEFRQRSKQEVGLAGLLSRVTAGVVDGTPVVVLPGSENAVRLGVGELLLPELDHLLHLVHR
jgi:molybdenum cofactor biosynthesis protein B